MFPSFPVMIGHGGWRVNLLSRTAAKPIEICGSRIAQETRLLLITAISQVWRGVFVEDSA